MIIVYLKLSLFVELDHKVLADIEGRFLDLGRVRLFLNLLAQANIRIL